MVIPTKSILASVTQLPHRSDFLNKAHLLGFARSLSVDKQSRCNVTLLPRKSQVSTPTTVCLALVSYFPYAEQQIDNIFLTCPSNNVRYDSMFAPVCFF